MHAGNRLSGRTVRYRTSRNGARCVQIAQMKRQMYKLCRRINVKTSFRLMAPRLQPLIR